MLELKPASSIPSGVNVVALISGLLLLAGAIFFSNVTLVSQDYGSVLLAALLLAIFADICFVILLFRGGLAWRIVGALLILLSLYVFVEVARRGL